MAAEDISDTDPGALSKLMTLNSKPLRAWHPEELAAVYRHQMSAVLQIDLAGFEQGLAERILALSSSQGLLVRSYADLLQHPDPPIELLILIKRFAKAGIGHPDARLPDEVARVLYYLSIIVAFTRCGQRITELDDRSLQTGIEWAIALPWIDDVARTILRQGVSAFGSHKDESP